MVERIDWNDFNPYAGWFKTLVCALLGHRDSNEHPHVAMCYRCRAMGVRYHADGTVNTGYPNDRNRS